jgi:hypothetical protein
MISILNNLIGRVIGGAVKGAVGSVLPEKQKQTEQKGSESMNTIINAIIRWGLAILGGGVLGDTISATDISTLQTNIQTLIGAIAVIVPIIWSIVEKMKAKKTTV